LDEAAAEAKSALAMSPAPGMAASLHMQLGLVSYVRKDDTAALASFNEALRLDPTYAEARKNAGIALGNLGRNAEAVEQLQIYLNANPKDQGVAAAIAALRAAQK
jgi:lipoprotein NlpI